MVAAQAVLLMSAASARLDAQQYISDDAAVTEYRACQIQMWHGERSSWVLPVCTPIPGVELSLGFIAVWRDGADGHVEYVAQAKTAIKPLAKNSWGIGFVLGTGRDPAFSGVAKQSFSHYAYVPLSLSLLNDRIILHQNSGWLYQRREGQGLSAATWAIRSDVMIAPRYTMVAEVFGASDVGRRHGAGAEAEYQLGLRCWLRPDHVVMDISHGSAVRTGREGAGWTIGLALITPPFL